ncbi:MAG: 16S rRNA (cytosine(1402)-N(4))-methyltransferase RsmH [Planctomycetota bacterium]
MQLPKMNPSHASILPAPEISVAHRSVLLQESICVLNLQPGDCVVDCTLGAGGHAAEFIEKIKPGGRLIGLDVDPEALHLARTRLEPLALAAAVKADFFQINFGRIASVPGVIGANAIFADLGVSSMQLDRPERGFSFRFDAPLDMRMDPALPMTAADILREYSEEQLANVFFYLGEERASRRIARIVVALRYFRPILTTDQLKKLVCRALRVRGHRRIHPATKTFQALRMAVNHEMESLAAFLEVAPELLSAGGALAVISFQSLEDRQIKQCFKVLVETGRFQQIVKLTRSGKEETALNRRSRSAKLRAIRKLASVHHRATEDTEMELNKITDRRISHRDSQDSEGGMV